MARDAIRLDKLDQGQGRREDELAKHSQLCEPGIWGWPKYLRHGQRRGTTGTRSDQGGWVHVTEGHFVPSGSGSLSLSLS